MTHFTPNPAGPFQRWEDPVDGEEYVIGVDPAMGRTSGGDHTCFQVFKTTMSAFVHVAQWYGIIQAGEAGELGAELGSY